MAIGQFEWDEDKAASNLKRHGVAFSACTDLDWSRAFSVEDSRKDYGEARFVTIAPIRDRVCVMVWTPRADRYRVFSLRKANRREIALFKQAEEEGP